MKTRTALTLLLVIASLADPNGTDQIDHVEFSLRDGYQVIAPGSLGTLDRLNLLIDTGSFPTVLDDRIAKQLRLRTDQAETVVFDRKIRTRSAMVSSLRVGPVVADTVVASVGDLSYLGAPKVDAI